MILFQLKGHQAKPLGDRSYDPVPGLSFPSCLLISARRSLSSCGCWQLEFGCRAIGRTRRDSILRMIYRIGAIDPTKPGARKCDLRREFRMADMHNIYSRVPRRGPDGDRRNAPAWPARCAFHRTRRRALCRLSGTEPNHLAMSLSECAVTFHGPQMLVDLGHEVLILMPGVDTHDTAVPHVGNPDRGHPAHGIAHGRQRGNDDIRRAVVGYPLAQGTSCRRS